MEALGEQTLVGEGGAEQYPHLGAGEGVQRTALTQQLVPAGEEEAIHELEARGDGAGMAGGGHPRAARGARAGGRPPAPPATSMRRRSKRISSVPGASTTRTGRGVHWPGAPPRPLTSTPASSPAA